MAVGAVESSHTIADIEDAKLIHSIEVAKRFGRKTAHDFNNILAVVQGFASILQNRLQRDEANLGIAQQIEASALEALRLTNWLSTFANNQPTELASLDLNKVVEECLTAFCSEKPPGVDLQAELAPGPLFLIGDEAQLEQVCRELWSNAVEAMPQGGQVRVQTSVEELPQRSAPGQGIDGLSRFCRLRISDTGMGLDPEAQKHMFEPFFTTKSGKDRGLGLSTVYDVVRAHQGFVQVTSEPGAGTSIDLYFPAQDRHDSEGRPEQKSGKVLVVDDEEMIRIMVQHMLKGQACEVMGVASGEAALDAYQKANGEIKAVILDMTLPGMNGAETFRKLKELDSHLKVIVSTGDPHQQAVHDMMAQGAFGILAKPFSVEHLRQVVLQALD
jgi:two-component system cell cycle sensor histidine kinase/response regulator CckA